MAERKRLIWADSLKGLLIMLMVLGHAIQYTLGDGCYEDHLWNVIYSFHMPAFMAISGFLVFRPNVELGGHFWKLTFRRFRQLIIPFILWTAISQIVRGNIDFENLGTYLLYPDKGLWFLWVLFFINVIFLVGSFLALKAKIKQDLLVLIICIFLVAVMVRFEVRVFGYQFISYYFLFYTLGYFFHKYENYVTSSNVILLSFLGVCWAVLAWFWQMHELPEFMKGLPLPATITQYAYRFVTAAIAVYLLHVLSPKVLNGTHKWNQPLVKLGEVSLGIYVVHFLFLNVWIRLFNEIGMNEECVISCSFVMTLAMTWMIVWLLSKWHVTETWLLGKL